MVTQDILVLVDIRVTVGFLGIRGSLAIVVTQAYPDTLAIVVFLATLVTVVFQATLDILDNQAIVVFQVTLGTLDNQVIAAIREYPDTQDILVYPAIPGSLAIQDTAAYRVTLAIVALAATQDIQEADILVIVVFQAILDILGNQAIVDTQECLVIVE